VPLAPLVRWILSSFVLALLAVEHVRLARRSTKKWAWFVPLAPAIQAWGRGERFAAIVSFGCALAWVVLRLTA
jgi:hypothetical protein